MQQHFKVTPNLSTSELMTETNRAVLAEIDEKSAHSDVAEALTAAMKPLGNVQFSCPDSKQFAYVAASTKRIIFGFAIGMNTVAFRLDERLRNRALATGASAYLACGPEWVSFELFRDDWPRADLEFWALKAY